MRNSIFLTEVAKKTCDFNYAYELQEKIEKIIPKSKLHIKSSIHEWGTQAKEKIQKIKELL